MSAADELSKEIEFHRDGVTIGGEKLPGLIGNVSVTNPSVGQSLWTIAVTFVTDRMPISSSSVVNELANEGDSYSYLVRPALPGDD